jgi:hypothetical protein
LDCEGMNLSAINSNGGVIFPSNTMHIWEHNNCFGELARLRLVTYDNKHWLWAYKDGGINDWVGYTDVVDVIKALRRFHGRREKSDE